MLNDSESYLKNRRVCCVVVKRVTRAAVFHTSFKWRLISVEQCWDYGSKQGLDLR